MTRLAAALAVLLMATAAEATSTVQWYAPFDSAADGTAASVAQFRQGVDATNPPTFETDDADLFPGARNLVRFSAPASGTSYGIAGTFTPAEDTLSGGAFLAPVAGPAPVCNGGSNAGEPCADAPDCPKTCAGGTNAGAACAADSACPSGTCEGWCQSIRTPVLAIESTSGARGCQLMLSRRCGSTNTAASPTSCLNASEIIALHYGDPPAIGGRCTASKTMNDTVCGLPCDDVSDCLPGRPLAPDDGQAPTQCVRNTNEAVDCGGAGSTKCHCINECDQRRPNESSCTAGALASVTLPAGTPYTAVVSQTNPADPGGATCAFSGGRVSTDKRCAGGSNDGAACAADSACPSGRCERFAETLPIRSRTVKVGVCVTGDSLAVGGRDGTACASNADCACQTDWPTYDPSCDDSTAICSTTQGGVYAPRITPARVAYGPRVAVAQPAAIDMALLVAATGTDPVLNWRHELLRADGDGAVAQWTASGASCAGWNCWNAGSSTPGAGTEPDGNSSRLQHTTSSNFIQEVQFLGPTSADPIPAVTFEVAAQDTESLGDRSIGLDLTMFDGASTTATVQVNLEDLPTSGAADGIYAPILLTSATKPGGGDWDATALAAVRGRAVKVDLNGPSREGRMTFGGLGVMRADADPVPSDIVPKGADNLATGGIVGESKLNDAALYSDLVTRPMGFDNLYDMATGGAGAGDMREDWHALRRGVSSAVGMTAEAVIGELGHPLDVAFIEPGINTLHAGAPTVAGVANPANPAAFAGVGQAGYCEHWTPAGYGPFHGKPCACRTTINWRTAARTTFPFLSHCLVKSAAFFGATGRRCLGGANIGAVCVVNSQCPGSSCDYCACSSNAECETMSMPSGTVTTSTCSSKKCTSTYANLAANAPATTRSWEADACDPTTGAIGCPGVCIDGNSTADIMDAVIAIDRERGDTEVVWITTPYPVADGPGALGGWWQTRAQVDALRGDLLAYVHAHGRDFMDLHRWLYDHAPTELSTKTIGTSGFVYREGLHYKEPTGHALVGQLFEMCASNLDMTGAPTGATDGVCTAGACTGGALGKLGLACTADRECGYFNCGPWGA